MLHYVFWLALLASCLLFRFVPSMPIELFTLMLASSYAIGIAALVHEARHPDPTAAGAAAHASRVLLIGMAPILLMFLSFATGTDWIVVGAFKIAVVLFGLLMLYLLFCALLRAPPVLLTALLVFMFSGGSDS